MRDGCCLMKKIDKLILTSFVGPFILTFLVVVFILLTQHMIKYFDDIVGKDLGWDVLGTLLFYFAVFMTPIAIPLAVLLSSLITFGNLGEHFELTAIKASGISLLRALFPIFIFVLFLTVFAFYSNNTFVPRAALEAYSLLYDIKQKKPSMDLKEGAFYGGIPDYSIKVEKKHEDGQRLEDIIIYDHTQKTGNKEVTIADSGRMYTVLNDRYLKLELYNGNTYIEGASEVNVGTATKQEFTQSRFQKSQIVLDLSSFQLDRTDKDLFSGNRNMRNISELKMDVDSMNREMLDYRVNNFRLNRVAFNFLFRENSLDMPEYLEEYENQKMLEYRPGSEYEYFLPSDTVTSRPVEQTIITEPPTNLLDSKAPRIVIPGEQAENTLPSKQAEKTVPKKNSPSKRTEKTFPSRQSDKIAQLDNLLDKEPGTIEDIKLHEKIETKKNEGLVNKAIDSIRSKEPTEKEFNLALNDVRQIKSRIEGNKTRVELAKYEKNVFQIQWHKILSNSFACIIMFLIGAPLGAIIKKGGLGVPVLVSIVFFIIFYVLNMTGEKYAKQDFIDPWLGIWAANLILLPVGLFFLRQARIDARLFESDFYNVMIDRLNTWVLKRRKKNIAT